MKTQKIQKNKRGLKIILFAFILITSIIAITAPARLNAASSIKLSATTQAALENKMKDKTFWYNDTKYHISPGNGLPDYYNNLYANKRGVSHVTVTNGKNAFGNPNGKVNAEFKITDPITSLIPFKVFDELKSQTGVYYHMGEKWGVIIDSFLDENSIRHMIVQLIEISINDTIEIDEFYKIEIKPVFEVHFVWISKTSGVVNLYFSDTVNFGSSNQPADFTSTGPTGLYALPSYYISNYMNEITLKYEFKMTKRNYINNFAFSGILTNEQDANPEHIGYDPEVDYGAYFVASDMNFNSYLIDDLVNPKKRIDGITTEDGVFTFLGVASLFDPTPISGAILTTVDVMLLVNDINITTLPPDRYFNYTSPFQEYYFSSHSLQIDNYGHLIKDCAILLDNKDYALTLHGSEKTFARGIYKISQQRKLIGEGVREDRYWISRFESGFNFDIRRYNPNDNFAETVAWSNSDTVRCNSANYKKISSKIINNEFSFGLDQPFTIYNYNQNTNYYKIKLPNGYYRINLNQSLYNYQFTQVPSYNSTLNAYYFNGDTEYILEIISKNNDISIDSFSIDLIEIGKSAFTNRTDFSKIIIPNTVTKIGNNAFSYCTNLEIIILSEIKTIENDAFIGCTKLTSIVREFSVTASSNNYYYLTIQNIGNATVKIDGITTNAVNSSEEIYLNAGKHVVKIEANNVSQILSNPTIEQVSAVVVGYPLDIKDKITSNRDLFSFQNYGARFVNFALIATKNGTIYYPKGAIVIKDVNGNIIQKCKFLGLVEPAENIENSNNLTVYLPSTGKYYVEVNLTDTSITSLKLSANLTESITINLFNVYEHTDSNWLGFLGKARGDEVKILNLMQSGRFEIVLQYNGNNDLLNGMFMIVNESTNEIIEINNNSVNLEAGSYYICYFNAMSVSENDYIDVGIYRQVTSHGSQYLLTAPNATYNSGSETRLNGGAYGGNIITQGFTRLIYLDYNVPTAKISRLLYDWYSSNENAAIITDYGTVLALPVTQDTIVKIMAVYKDDPSKVYVKEFIIRKEVNPNDIIINHEMTIAVNTLKSIDLSNIIVPINILQYYNWSCISSYVYVDQFGRVTAYKGAIGQTVQIVGNYKYNSRVKIVITLIVS